MNTKRKGDLAEKKAKEFLLEKEFEILQTNFYCKGGEIDIIAYKRGVFHFIEVKSGENFEPIYNITPKKLNRIVKCAYFYMKKNDIKNAFCIDAVIVKKESLEFIENLTL
jgi:putative endonuclease